MIYGCNNKHYGRGMCQRDYMLEYHRGTFGNWVRPTLKGPRISTWKKDERGYLKCSIKDRTRFQHQIVMEMMLDRELVPGEEVHHKNGVRDDNRPENLELWVVSQPKGQRPEDLVDWANDIIRRYG